MGFCMGFLLGSFSSRQMEKPAIPCRTTGFSVLWCQKRCRPVAVAPQQFPKILRHTKLAKVFWAVQEKLSKILPPIQNCPKHPRQFSFYSILFSNISAILYIVLTQLCNISYPCQTNGFSSWIPKS